MQSKPRLRNSKDIYHRLKWGGSLPTEKVHIGYMDRIEGMKEIPFARFRPGGRIPWDRVWYFKLNGNLVWDRKTRLDRVFGSGNTQSEEKLDYQPPKGGGFPAEFEIRKAWVFDKGIGTWSPFQGGEVNSTFLRRGHLRLVSYNVLRSDDNRPGLEHDLRIPELIREIDALDADIVLLQEVQAPFWKMLLRMSWVRDRYYLSCGPDLTPGKALEEVVLSKWPPQQVNALRFSKEKEVTGMRFIINGHPFSIYTLHLPSDMARGAEDKRYRYLKELSHALPDGENVLIGGDFNVDSDLPLPDLYQDLWALLKGNEGGETFAPSRNPLAKIVSASGQSSQAPPDQKSSQSLHSPKPSASPDRRLDRIFLYNPDRRFLPQSISLLGQKPKSRHGETIYLSDHYGLLVEIALETTVAALQKVPTTHQSALVYIPPPSTWAEIQAIRRQYDRSFHRWMPHINLLYGFLPEQFFTAAAPMIRQALSEEAFFQLDLNSFGQSNHGRSQTIWLKPDQESEQHLQQIQSVLKELFPNCIEQDQDGQFTPHLSIARVNARNEGRASRLREEWAASWENMNLDVGVVALISRSESGPFSVKEVIPLGEEVEWESLDPTSWDLHISLGALGLLPGFHHHAAAQRTQNHLFNLVRTLDPKAQLYSVGSFGLGVRGPVSRYDFLSIGRLGREEFLRLVADELGGLDHLRLIEDELVPVLECSFEGYPINLMYVTYPDEVPMMRPSHLPTESFRHFDVPSKMTLSASLEVAALRRFIGPDHGAFQTAVLALKAWARAQQIDSEAFGFPSGLGWTLLLAVSPSEEAPELWLERCFTLLASHDWRLPLMPIEGFYPEDIEAPMQVVTASSPARNVTRKVTQATLSVLLESFNEGLAAIWNIRQDGGKWTDFFTPAEPVIGQGFEIQLAAIDRYGLHLLQSWVRRHFRSLLLALEPATEGIRPWTDFISDGGFEGWYTIGIRSVTDSQQVEAALEMWKRKFASWTGRPKGGRMRFRWSAAQ